MAAADPQAITNSPDIGWGQMLAPKDINSHKYDHGHVVCLGGKRLTGAICLASEASLRMGAGLCTIAAHTDAADVYRAHCASVMVEFCDEMARFKDHVIDARRNVAVIGPGAGQENVGAVKKAVLDCVQLLPARTCILDADALTVFADNPRILLNVTGPHCVLTPHEGEFEKLFPLLQGNKVERAQAAAIKSRSIVVLKGAETIIASPEGGCVVNQSATGWLATAGTGDVLAGMIAGLAARSIEGMSLFGAVCAAVWMHGEIGRRLGPGMISADMAAVLPTLWRELLEEAAKQQTKSQKASKKGAKATKLPAKKSAARTPAKKKKAA